MASVVKLVRWIVGVLVLGVVGVVGLGMFGPAAWKDAVSDALSSLNPLDEERVNRTGPSVMVALRDLEEYHAATGYYETVVDIEDDSKLPSFVKGERVLYVGKGEVDAMVDFGDLDEQRVTVSDDRLSATIRLPVPTIDEPALDLEESYVVEHESGLADKFGGSDLEQQAQLEAVDQMEDAAEDGDALTDLARKNTDAMLRGLLGALGFVNVTVSWDDEPEPEPTTSPNPQ